MSFFPVHDHFSWSMFGFTPHHQPNDFQELRNSKIGPQKCDHEEMPSDMGLLDGWKSLTRLDETVEICG
jgi:hypothetical protein